MDKTNQQFGIRIYAETPPILDPTQYPPTPSPLHQQPSTGSRIEPTPVIVPTAPTGHGPHKRRAAVAKGVQRTLSKTSMLAHFLPTGTLLTFEMVLPSIYGIGQCTAVTTTMTLILLLLCALSCFFFHFTDSFRAHDGTVYFGIVTPKGLAVFKTGLDVEVPKDDKFKAHFADLVHAVMSVMVFLAIAFSDHRVTNCLLHGHAKEMEEVMESFPLMVGIVCSSLFLIFPKARYGIGCMAS